MSNEQRAVRLYGVRRMDLHWWGDDCLKQAAMTGKGNCEPVYLASDYDALSTELAEAKAEIERMREALDAYRLTRNAVIAGLPFSWSDVDKLVNAALIPAKGKGE